MQWETSDGQKIEISDMTDVHLLNCIRWVQRLSVEWAAIAWGISEDDIWYDHTYGKEVLEMYSYDALCLEAAARGLPIPVNKAMDEILKSQGVW